MLEQVVGLLAQLQMADCNEGLLSVLLDNTVASLKTLTNRAELPAELEHVAVYRTVGAYLKTCRLSGTLNGVALDRALRSVKEGDTEVVYCGSDANTPEQNFDLWVASLCDCGEREVLACRCLRW